ncbi:MFS transporter [Pseudomaricurvus alkylphenolicus]|uniref:MFS transporter n=1 Tax=Pseudomaricurvus alkylphenolicus TaxID=1306991 RepID=UPI001F10AD52|nr:MFS transporter [Pseudomaricurvus alkylphenolicus]
MTSSTTHKPTTNRSAFAEPQFRRYFISMCFSTLAGWLVRFLFGWNAWEFTHSAFWVGVVAGSLLLPIIFFSPFFGIISDRINPRKGLVVTVGAQSLVAALASLASAMDMLNLWSLIALSACLGVASSAHTPIRLALVPKLVKREALPNAIGYAAIVFNTSRVLGPALGAWLVAVLSVPSAFFSATLLCVVAAIPLLLITGVRGGSHKSSAGMFSDLKQGFVYAASNRVIRLILSLTLLNALLGRTLLELLPAFSGQLLNGTAETLATLTAAAGTGSILGGLLVTRQSGHERVLFRMVGIALTLAALCLFSIQWLQGLYALCGLIFVLSMLSTIAGISSQALAQLTVDEDYRGRVLSLWSMLAMGAPALGAVGIGALAQSWGFPAVTAVTGVIVLIILAVLRISSNRAAVSDQHLSRVD